MLIAMVSMPLTSSGRLSAGGSFCGSLMRQASAAKSSSVKNADRPEKQAEFVLRKYSILQDSGVWDLAFLRFWISLFGGS